MTPCVCPACRPLTADGTLLPGRPFKVRATARLMGDGYRIEYHDLIKVPPGHTVSIRGPGLRLDGEAWEGGACEVEVTITPTRPRPIPARASEDDRRRLRAGYAALKVLAVEPLSQAEAHAALKVLTDGACALKSIVGWDVLGVKERGAVNHDLAAITARGRELADRMVDGEFPDVVTGCTKGTTMTAVTPATAPRALDPGESLPRCDKLDGSSLSIVVSPDVGIEAGRFCEAQAVTITDGTRTAVYVPLEHLLFEREQHQIGGI